MKEKLRRRYGWWIESRDDPSFVPRRSILLGAAPVGCHSWVEQGREAERAEVITGRDGVTVALNPSTNIGMVT